MSDVGANIVRPKPCGERMSDVGANIVRPKPHGEQKITSVSVITEVEGRKQQNRNLM